MSEVQQPNDQADSSHDKADKRREIVGTIGSTVLWFSLDLHFLYPENHTAALWSAVVFLSLQVVGATLIKWKYAISVSVFFVLVGGLLQLFWLPPTPPKETETHYYLTAGTDPTPTNGCANMAAPPPNAVLVFFGSSVVWFAHDDFTALTVGTCTNLHIQRRPKGVFVSGDIVAQDTKIVARIDRNIVDLNTQEIFAPQKSDDGHALTVDDQEGHEAFYTRYLNPNAITIRGKFFCTKDGVFLLVTSDRIERTTGATGKTTHEGDCTAESGNHQGFVFTRDIDGMM